MNRTSLFILIAALGCFVCLPPVFAQTEHTKYDKDKTLRSSARVNPSTLAMEFSLPITGLSGRAGNSLGLSLEYSSKVWGANPDTFHNGGTQTNVMAKYAERSSSGWNSTLDVPRLSISNTADGFDTSNETELYKTDGTPWKESSDQSWTAENFSLVYISRIRVTMPSGATGELRRDDGDSHAHGTEHDHRVPKSNVYQGTYLSTDGSKMRLDLSWANNELRSVLYLPDGSRYFDLPGEYAIARDTVYIDEHGNRMVYNSGTRLWSDTLGRSIKNPLISDLYSEPTEGMPVYDYPGLGSQRIEYQLVWQKLETQHTNLAYQSTSYCLGAYVYPVPSGSPNLFNPNGTTTRFCGSDALFNPVVLTEARLPGGMVYKFKYNLYAEIEKIEYPTGGYEKFVYAYLAPISSTSGMAYDQLNRGVTERRVSASGASQDEVVWTYEVQKETTSTQNGPYHVKTTAPDGTLTEQLLKDRYSKVSAPFGFDDASIGRSYEDRVWSSTNPRQLLRRKLTKWTQTGPVTIDGVAGHYKATRDLRPEKEITIIFEPGSSNALAMMSETIYETPGQNGAPSDETYFAALNARQTKIYHYVALPAANAENWTIDQILPLFSSANLATVNETKYLYDANYKARGILSLPTETQSLNPANLNDVLAKSEIKYDETTYPIIDVGTTTGYQALTGAYTNWHGNATTSRTWVKETDTWLETHAQYDNFGNLRKAWDISGDPGRYTETVYEHTTEKPYCYAYPTKVITPAPGDGTYGTTETSFATTGYDFNTGLPLSVTDEFGQTTKTEYDAMLRPKRVYADNFTAPEAQTVYGIPDSTGQLPVEQRFVKIRKQIDGTNWDEAITWFDGLGRTIKTTAKDSQGDVIVETVYDQMGRVQMTTNPYRSADANKYWNLIKYDELGRVEQTYEPVVNQNPDEPTGNILGTTVYELAVAGDAIGTAVTTIDASGRKGRSITNALGQLTRVDEPASDNTLNPLPTPEPTPSGTPTPYPTPIDCYNSFLPDPDCELNRDQNSVYPSLSTYYRYNAQGKMVEVEQGGQKRFFLYDFLGRLIRVRQPEQEVSSPALDKTDAVTGNNQWTSAFAYDIFGNVKRSTDAKGINIVYQYDKANRLIKRCYTKPNVQTTATECIQITGEQASVDTPLVEYYYDGKGLAAQQSPNYVKGKLTKVTSSVSETRYTKFDKFGRLEEMEQRTPFTDMETVATATPRVSKYAYNLSGALTKETYPSGRVVENTFEADGDLATVRGRSSNGLMKNYATGFSYTAAGLISELQLGNSRWETAKFNHRQQIEELALGISATDTSLWKLNYDYNETLAGGTTANMGNIAKQTISFAGLANPFIQTYQYDSLYRLKEAVETSAGARTWEQTFAYDRFGNRISFKQILGYDPLVINNLTLPPVDAATNRFRTGTGYHYSYDKNGNITDDNVATPQARSFTFNGENKQIEVKDANGSSIGKYYYDGEGKRVKKVTNLETTVFVYSAGKLVAEYSTATPPQNPTTNYVATDTLQSVRAITNQQGEVTSRRDFMPFGEELYANSSTRTTANKYSTDNQDAVRQRFTGYEKDRETQLDFAEARYYNNSHGRFTAVDPLLASGKSANPQTFNRYVYVGNNPTNITDPFGLDWYKDKNGVRRWSADGKTFDYAADGNYYAEGATRDAVDENWERIVGDDFAYERADGNWVALDPNSTLWKDGFATKDAALGQMRSWYNGGNASALSGEIGMRGSASMKFLGLLMLTGLSGGAGAAGTVGTGTFWLIVGAETFTAQQSLQLAAEIEHENSLMMGNTRSSGIIDPFKVNFSQDSIKNSFSAGGSIDDLAEGLKNGSINPQSVEPIRLVEKNGEMFSLDNRRLEAFRRANVSIPYRMATPSEVQRARTHFTTRDGGKSIRIRGR